MGSLLPGRTWRGLPKRLHRCRLAGQEVPCARRAPRVCLRGRSDSWPHSASRRMASPTAAPGPVQGSSAQPPASGRFWGLVDVPKARMPPWARLETGPTQDWTRPLCAQQPGSVLALRRPLNSGVLPVPPGSPLDPGSVTKARKATLLRSGPWLCRRTGSATGQGHGGRCRARGAGDTCLSRLLLGSSPALQRSVPGGPAPQSTPCSAGRAPTRTQWPALPAPLFGLTWPGHLLSGPPCTTLNRCFLCRSVFPSFTSLSSVQVLGQRSYLTRLTEERLHKCPNYILFNWINRPPT